MNFYSVTAESGELANLTQHFGYFPNSCPNIQFFRMLVVNLACPNFSYSSIEGFEDWLARSDEKHILLRNRWSTTILDFHKVFRNAPNSIQLSKSSSFIPLILFILYGWNLCRRRIPKTFEGLPPDSWYNLVNECVFIKYSWSVMLCVINVTTFDEFMWRFQHLFRSHISAWMKQEQRLKQISHVCNTNPL